MVTVESAHGPLRLIDVYYAQNLEDIDALKANLSPNKIVYIRQAPITFDLQQFAGWYRPFSTILLDLERDIEELFKEASSTCRRQIRRIDRMPGHIAIGRNDPVVCSDFRKLYNGFVARSRHAEPLSRSRLDLLRPITDVFVAYFEGRPLCGHIFVRDQTIGRVGLLLSASTRLEGEDPPGFVGAMNRWLHWYEVRLYKSEGMLQYDFGGAGTDTPREAGIAWFKQSFGGRQVLEHNYIAAGPVGRVAIALFYAMRRIRSARWTSGPGGRLTNSGWTDIRRAAAAKEHEKSP